MNEFIPSVKKECDVIIFVFSDRNCCFNTFACASGCNSESHKPNNHSFKLLFFNYLIDSSRINGCDPFIRRSHLSSILSRQDDGLSACVQASLMKCQFTFQATYKYALKVN